MKYIKIFFFLLLFLGYSQAFASESKCVKKSEYGTPDLYIDNIRINTAAVNISRKVDLQILNHEDYSFCETTEPLEILVKTATNIDNPLKPTGVKDFVFSFKSGEIIRGNKNSPAYDNMIYGDISFSKEGTNYVKVCVDNSNIISESIEWNNCSSWKSIDVFHMPYVDLVASAGYGEIVKDTKFADKYPFRFSGTIKNYGPSSTDYLGAKSFDYLIQLTTGFYKKADGIVDDLNRPFSTDDYYSDSISEVVDGEGTISWFTGNGYSGTYRPGNFVTLSGGFYAPYQYGYYRICADMNSFPYTTLPTIGHIVESNENNNCSQWAKINEKIVPAEPVVPPVETKILPDLTVIDYVTPQEVNLNKATKFYATIKNIGEGSTGSTFSNFFQSATDVTDINNPKGVKDYKVSVVNPILEKNNTFEASASITFTSGDKYYVRACADKSESSSVGVIAESNENNNCGNWTLVKISNLCLDNKAENYNLKLPCFYDPTFCKIETDPNYGKAPCAKSDVCLNGATNYPLCTITKDNVCKNGADNPPLCTVKDGKCLNGAKNPPVCTDFDLPGGDCFDKIKNGDEAGVDCGGRCLPDKKCKRFFRFFEF